MWYKCQQHWYQHGHKYSQSKSSETSPYNNILELELYRSNHIPLSTGLFFVFLSFYAFFWNIRGSILDILMQLIADYKNYGCIYSFYYKQSEGKGHPLAKASVDV